MARTFIHGLEVLATLIGTKQTQPEPVIVLLSTVRPGSIVNAVNCTPPSARNNPNSYYQTILKYSVLQINENYKYII